jgi:hypothetical protein
MPPYGCATKMVGDHAHAPDRQDRRERDRQHGDQDRQRPPHGRVHQPHTPLQLTANRLESLFH